MPRPIVIINPLSSGIELSRAFKQYNIPAIAITLENRDIKGYGAKIRDEDFIDIIPNQENIVNIIKQYDPLGFIPGTENAVSLAEYLTNRLTPQFANDDKKSLHRIHKAFMQQALQDAGLPYLKTINATSVDEIEIWLAENCLHNTPLIIKPPISAGSDNVFHVEKHSDWKVYFNRVLHSQSKINGLVNQSVVVQEQAIGTEFAIGTVSAHGKHYLSHIIQYNKCSSGKRKTIFDYVEFIPYNENKLGGLFSYTKKSLDALGIRFGACHTEIMLTNHGPRLIETGARMCGGPVVNFSREVSGSSQADKLAEIFFHGDVITKHYDFKKTLMPVFLKSPAQGVLSNLEIFNHAPSLATFFNQYTWYENGEMVPQTVDYLTSIGIIALTGDRDKILRDYKKIREMEAKLAVR